MPRPEPLMAASSNRIPIKARRVKVRQALAVKLAQVVVVVKARPVLAA
jgi:hypothetical protein